MRCSVFRSERKEYTYLYLAQNRSWDDIPSVLREMFEPAERVMELDLTRREKLAQEDIHTVLENLNKNGYHLQLPADQDPEQLIAQRLGHQARSFKPQK